MHDDASFLESLINSYIDESEAPLGDFAPEFIYNSSRRESPKRVVDAILRCLEDCDEYFFSVAFIKESGLVCLKERLRELDRKGIKGRILTSDYLTFTEPKALESLLSFRNLEARMYLCGDAQTNDGFHTKAYIFRYGNRYKAIIGSSNLTQAALTTSNEWNNAIVSTGEGSLIQEIIQEYERLYQIAVPVKGILSKYREIYEAKPVIYIEKPKNEPQKYHIFNPNEMQKAFAINLEQSIERGETKGLLISATGTGKTFASAYGVREIKAFEPNRLLFITHRETILRQAMRTYEAVFEGKKTTGLFTGLTQSYEGKDFVFATRSMLAEGNNLMRFRPDEFDLVIIDEAHHVGHNTYQKIISYFRPRYLLGMSATPDRVDGYDVYEAFGHNVLCEIRLRRALESGFLCPFHYFGISELKIGGEEIDERSAYELLISPERVDYIIEQMRFFGYSGDRLHCLAFSRSVQEGEDLASAFQERGYRALFLSGEDSQETREEAINRLSMEQGEDALDIIFAVDIFNEGVDVPEINQVLLLRPTESPIVFLQQLGRGLRLSMGKEYVVVIDFIANYRNNYLIPLAFSEKGSGGKGPSIRTIADGQLTGASTIAFDEVSKENIYKSIEASRPYAIRGLKEAYGAAKNRLGHIPTLVEFDEISSVSARSFLDLSTSQAASSYYAFKRFYIGEDIPTLDATEITTLRLLGELMGNGMRPHEALILKALMDGRSYEEAVSAIRAIGFAYGERECRSVLSILDFSFLKKDGKELNAIPLVKGDERGGLFLSYEAKKAFENGEFKKEVMEIIDYSLYSWRTYFHAPYSSALPFNPYEKYTRKDVSRLINLDRNRESTLYGYRVFEERGIIPIFVTYHKSLKDSDSTNYEDRFAGKSAFDWISRNNRTLQSNEIKDIMRVLDKGGKALLFIKKNDADSSFYFVGASGGLVSYSAENIVMKGGQNAVRFHFRLERPIRDDIYSYLLNGVSLAED